jgi:cytochrome c oxidase cbb3-type subunit 3
MKRRHSLFYAAPLLVATLLLAVSPAGAAEEKYANAIKNYETYCVQCHGLGRNGKGVNTPDMSVQPRDHSDSKAMGDIPDAEVVRAIKEGGLAVNKSVLMPAWGHVLTDDEVTEMLAYLRHVCNCGTGK